MNKSISIQIARLKQVIADSYLVLEELGAIMPEERTSYNLVETIASLLPDESYSYEEVVEILTKNGYVLLDSNNNPVTDILIEELFPTDELNMNNSTVVEDENSTMNLSFEALSEYINN